MINTILWMTAKAKSQAKLLHHINLLRSVFQKFIPKSMLIKSLTKHFLVNLKMKIICFCKRLSSKKLAIQKWQKLLILFKIARMVFKHRK
jgi:hypothetical protein